ncbi:MAG: hypothetical protein PHP06_10900 [Clostridia bacterium]|nr:hypothetical protein [Clostridia bacterium]
MKKERVIANLKGTVYGKQIKREAQIFFTRHAEIDIDDAGLTKTSIRLLLEAASSCLLKKQEDERFRITTPNLPVNVFISGRIIYRDEEEIEVLVTNVSRDIFVTSEKTFKI